MALTSKRVLCGLFLSLMLSFCIPAGAAPYFNTPWEFDQPDGSKVQVILNGDEFYMEAKTPEGYTVVRDEATGWICYAELSADGSELVSTGVPVGMEAATQALGTGEKVVAPGKALGKGLTIAPEARLRKVNEKKQLLFGEDVEGIRSLVYPSPAEATMSTTIEWSLESDYQAAATVLPPTKNNTAQYNTTVRGLVLIFDFSDAPASYTLQQYTDKVNKPNFYKSNGNAASLRTYYEDVSRGTFIMNHFVYGVFRAPNTFAYYDSLNYAQGARELMSYGLNKMEAEGFDFSQLSTNSNGEIKALAVMYTGNPAAWAEGMWYHASGWGGFSADGVRTGPYCTDKANDLDPGTLIHEHGHMAAGWPDTYSYIGGEPGTWGVMGGGYCDLPNPYFLYENGWLDSENLLASPGLKMMQSADAHFAYCYYDPAQPTEFYFIRPYTRGLLYCPSIPDEGLTVWRINTQGDNANYPDRDRHIELVHANNTDNIKNRDVCFRAGGLLDHFTSTTTPSSNWKFGAMAGEPSGMDLAEVSAAGAEMTFVIGTVSEPVPYYPFNGSFTDASGSGQTPTGYGFASPWSGDVFRGSYFNLSVCLQLDGADDYVSCPATAGATDDLTVAFWVNPAAKGDMVVLDKFPADNSGAGWRVELTADGRAAFTVGSQANHTRITTAVPVYEAGRWVHLACTYADGTAKLFVNGALRMAGQGITQTVNTSALEVRMGIPSQTDTGRVYQGLLDDVRFYDLALEVGPLSTVDGLNFKPDKGAMAMLLLDDRSGTVARDASGQGYDGTLFNGLAFDSDSTAGPVGQALSFDGVDDYIELPPGMRKRNDGFTVALWAYPTAVKGWSRFIDFGNGSSSDNIILGRYQSSNDLFFEVYNGSSNGGRVQASGAIELDTWQFYAATVDGSGNVRIYKNGQLVKTGTSAAPAHVYRSRVYIGRSNWSSDAYYEGAMDDIRIYNYALSAAEITDLYRYNRTDGPVPFSGADGVSPETVLSFTPAANVLRHDVYFGTEYNAVLHADTASPEYMGRRLASVFNPARLEGRREYFWRVDEHLVDGSVRQGPVWRFTTGGGLERQVWTDLPSVNELTGLTSSADYPDRPSLVTELDTFEIPTNWGDSYGTRVHGLLVPQTSGNYQFWLSGDNEVELWLSTDTNPANATRIAYIHGTWSNVRSFDMYTSQRSGLISLQGGQAYYIMALHKEAVGGDHMAVAWQGPDSPTRQVIEGFWLQPPADNEWPRFAAGAGAVLSAAEGAALDETLTGAAQDPDGEAVRYSKSSGPKWLQVSPEGTLSGTPRQQDAGLNTFVLRAEDARGGWDEVELAIEVADRYTGAMGLGDLVGFAQEWLSANVESPANLDQIAPVDLEDFMRLGEAWNEGLVDGLEAHWALSDGAGLTARDGYTDRHGRLINMSEVQWMPGISSGSLVFDGVDDYVRIDGYQGVTGTQSRTVCAWVKMPKSATVQAILAYGSGNNAPAGSRWNLWITPDGYPIVTVAGANAYVTQSVADGTWHHVAVVLNGAGAPRVGDIRFYVDGLPAAAIFANSNQPINTTAGELVHIGANPVNSGDAGNLFKGQLGDVRLYSRALSETEVFEVTWAGLQGWWTLDETAGTAAGDSSGNGHNGTLVNSDSAGWGEGAVGGGLSLDGVDDYVRIDGYQGVTGTGSRTVCAWVKMPQSTTVQSILAYGSSNNAPAGSRWNLWATSDGYPIVTVAGANAYVTQNVADETWHHVAVVLDGAGAPRVGDMRFYVDGRPAAAIYANPNQLLNTTAGEFVHIGANPVSSGTVGNLFKGQLDDVRLYDRALNAVEIENLAAR